MEQYTQPEVTSAAAPVSTEPAFYIKYILPLSIIVAALIIGISFIVGVSIYSAALKGAGNAKPAAIPVDIKDVETKGLPFIGQENAKVTIAYWADYQCPFCSKFELEIFPELIKKYVDTGKVKIVFKDFPFLGPDSLIASEYSHAVWELYPEKFYLWHQAMYRSQDAENGGFGDEASVKKLTGTIAGIDANKVAALVKQKKEQYDNSITAGRTEGSSLGIQGTPSFIIGKTLVPGAMPVAAFSQLIDAELK